MKYKTPQLDGPVHLYETPMLLDVAEISGAEALDEAASWCVCVTSGSNDAAAAVDSIA